VSPNLNAKSIVVSFFAESIVMPFEFHISCCINAVCVCGCETWSVTLCEEQIEGV